MRASSALTAPCFMISACTSGTADKLRKAAAHRRWVSAFPAWPKLMSVGTACCSTIVLATRVSCDRLHKKTATRFCTTLLGTSDSLITAGT